MKPKSEFITIGNNIAQIEVLLQELVLQPRLKALEWSKITRQTPNMKIGYPGQHLASLITGIEGSRTGARGDDLRDGTEVKSCSRVDQLDTCKNCGEKILRIEVFCANCGSDKIKRMDDSKWLFSLKSENELKLLTEDIDRIFLTIADYPNFVNGDFDTIRFQAFEIWNNTERCKHFATLMSNYYYKIFLEHKSQNVNKTPAPKNFWPYSYQFYLCNPVKVFDCVVKNANTNPAILMQYFVKPDEDRSILEVEKMPMNLLTNEELKQFIEISSKEIVKAQIKDNSSYEDMLNLINASKLDKKALYEAIPFLDEEARLFLPLRDTDIIKVAKETYFRRK